MTGAFGIRRALPSPQVTIYDFSRENRGCRSQPDRLTGQDSIFPSPPAYPENSKAKVGVKMVP